MLSTTVGRAILELTVGDIARQDGFDAVVNAANAELLPGGGVAGALHRAAGPRLATAGRRYAPIRPGEAVITPAFDLPNAHVIHCLGPVFGVDEPAADLLASCYSRAVRLAGENGCRSIAFPAISTGAFGFPMRRAARIALDTVIRELRSVTGVERVRFVFADEPTRAVHAELLAELAGPGTETGEA